MEDILNRAQLISSPVERSTFLLIKGIERLQEGNPQEAKKFFEESLSVHPDNSAARTHLFALLVKDQDVDTAEALLRAAPDFNTNERWKYMLAVLLFRQGNKLEEALNITAELGERHPSLLATAATSLDRHKRGDLLVDFVLKHLEQFAGDIRRYVLERALKYAWNEKKDENTTATLLKAVFSAGDPHPAFLHNALEWAAHTGQWAKVQELLMQAAENTDDEKEKALLLMSAGEIAEVHLKNVQSALEAYTSSAKLYPSREVFNRIIILCEHEGDENTKKEFLREWIKIFPEDPEPRYELSRIFYRAGELSTAAELLVPVAGADPVIARFYLRILEDEGRWKDAAEFLRQYLDTLEKGETRESFIIQLAEILVHHLSDYETAESLLKPLLESEHVNPQGLSILAFIYREKNKWSDLVKVLDRLLAATTDPKETISYLMQKGEIYEFRLMDTDSALKCYQELYEIAPGHLPVLDALRRLYRKKKEWKRLLWVNDSKISLITDPAEHMALIRENAEIALHGLKDMEKFEGYLEQVVSYAPSDLDALSALFALAEKNSDKEKMLDVLKRIEESELSTDIKKRAIALQILLLLRENVSSAWECASRLLEANPSTELEWRALWACATAAGQEEKLAIEAVKLLPQISLEYLRRNVALAAAGVLDAMGNKNAALEALKSSNLSTQDLSAKLESMYCGENEELYSWVSPMEFRSEFLKKWKNYTSYLHEDAPPHSALKSEDDILFALLLALDARAEEGARVEALQRITAENEKRMLLPAVGLLEEKREVLENLPWDSITSAEAASVETEGLILDQIQLIEKSLEVLRQKEAVQEENLIALSLHLQSANRLDEALKLLEEINRPELRPQALITGAQMLEKAQRFQESARWLAKACELVKEPERRKETLHKLLVIQTEKLAAPEEAASTAISYLQEFPGDMEIVTTVTDTFKKQGKTEEAIDFIVNVTDHFPEEEIRALLFTSAADLAEKELNNPERALNVLQKARESLPSNTEIALAYCELLERLERWEELVEALKKRLEIEPVENHAEIHFKTGLVYETSLQEEDRAIEEYHLAVETDPSHLGAIQHLLILHYKRGNKELALKFAQAVRGREDECPANVLCTAGYAYLDAKKLDEAKTLFEKALEKDSKNVEAMKGLMSIHEVQEDWEAYFATASEFASALEKENPDLAARIHTESATVAREKLNKSEDALHQLRRAVNLDPKLFDARFLAADIMVKDLRKYREAINDARQALQLEPENEILWHHLAECHYAVKQHDHHFVALDVLSYFGKLTETEKRLHQVAAQRARSFCESPVRWEEVEKYTRAREAVEEVLETMKALERTAWNITGPVTEQYSEKIRPVPEHDKALIDIRATEKLFGMEKVQVWTAPELFTASLAGKPEVILPDEVARDVNARRFFFAFAAWTLKHSLSFLVFNDLKTIGTLIRSLAKYFDVEVKGELEHGELIDEKQVKKGLSWKSRFEIKNPVKSAASLNTQNLEKAKQQALENGLRFAASSLGMPSRVLKAAEQFTLYPETLQFILKFFTSETYFALRRTLDLSLVG